MSKRQEESPGSGHAYRYVAAAGVAAGACVGLALYIRMFLGKMPKVLRRVTRHSRDHSAHHSSSSIRGLLVQPSPACLQSTRGLSLPGYLQQLQFDGTDSKAGAVEALIHVLGGPAWKGFATYVMPWMPKQVQTATGRVSSAASNRFNLLLRHLGVSTTSDESSKEAEQEAELAREALSPVDLLTAVTAAAIHARQAKLLGKGPPSRPGASDGGSRCAGEDGTASAKLLAGGSGLRIEGRQGSTQPGRTARLDTEGVSGDGKEADGDANDVSDARTPGVQRPGQGSSSPLAAQAGPAGTGTGSGGHVDEVQAAVLDLLSSSASSSSSQVHSRASLGHVPGFTSVVEAAADRAVEAMGPAADRCDPLGPEDCPPVSPLLLPGLRAGSGGVVPQRTPRQDARSQAAAVLLNLLAGNLLLRACPAHSTEREGAEAGQVDASARAMEKDSRDSCVQWLEATPGAAVSTVGELVRALQGAGFSASASIETGPTTFGMGLCVDSLPAGEGGGDEEREDGRRSGSPSPSPSPSSSTASSSNPAALHLQPVPFALASSTGLVHPQSGKAISVLATHSALCLRIWKPRESKHEASSSSRDFPEDPSPSAREDAPWVDLQCYQGVEGFWGWHSSGALRPPWLAARRLHPDGEALPADTVAKAAEVASVGAAAAAATADDRGMPLGGYGLLGTCATSAALVEAVLFPKAGPEGGAVSVPGVVGAGEAQQRFVLQCLRMAGEARRVAAAAAAATTGSGEAGTVGGERAGDGARGEVGGEGAGEGARSRGGVLGGQARVLEELAVAMGRLPCDVVVTPRTAVGAAARYGSTARALAEGGEGAFAETGLSQSADQLGEAARIWGKQVEPGHRG